MRATVTTCWLVSLTLLGEVAAADPMPETRTGTFAGVDGVEIAYKRVTVTNPAGTIMVLPGFTESYLLYDELIADFAAHHYDVAIMDHRGMGLSGRLADNPQIVHVESFRDYVADTLTFMAKVSEDAPRPLWLFAHSTGGLIAIHALAESPVIIASVVLSAPLTEVKTEPVPAWAARLMSTALRWVGRGKDYLPGSGDMSLETFVYEGNRTTRSVERFGLKKEILLAHPEIMQGGASSGWLVEVMKGADEAMTIANKVRLPVLMLQAGDDDFVVEASQSRVCKALPDCQLLRFETGRHELFRETDEVRGPLMDAVLTRFARPP